jgi:hypothetical protein
MIVRTNINERIERYAAILDSIEQDGDLSNTEWTPNIIAKRQKDLLEILKILWCLSY